MIDWHRVRELQDEVGIDDFQEVVDLFLEEVDEVTERLENDPKPSEFEADFHFLKGCALNLGFQLFASICADGERKAANGSADEINVDEALSSYKESRKLFLSKIATQHAA